MPGAKRRRPEGRNRPSAFFSKRFQLKELLRRLLVALMVPVSRLYARGRRLQIRLYALGLCRTCRPEAVVVGVGGMSPESRGRVLLTSWLLGWARAQQVGAAVVAPLGEGRPPVLPYQVTAGGDPDESGIEAALLCSYASDVRCLIDADPIRAATAALRAFSPHMLVLQDALGDPRLARDADLAILTAEDLGPGWNRVFPAGSWRCDASILQAASAYCVFAGRPSLEAVLALAGKRLGHLGKPIFSLTFDIWRWRGQGGVIGGEELAGSPYVAVLGESDRDLLPDMLRRHIGVAPRMIFYVHDRHRFTRQDFENLHADAERLKARNILTSPRFELKLRQGGDALAEHAVWTYDPEVAFGPSLATDLSFLSWWETVFLTAARGRITPRGDVAPSPDSPD